MLIKQHCGHSVCVLFSDRCVHRCVMVCVKWCRVRLRLYGPWFFSGTGVHSTGWHLTLRWPYKSHTGQRSQSQIPRSWFDLHQEILTWYPNEKICTHQVWTFGCFLVCVCGSEFPLSSWREDEEPEHKSRNSQIILWLHLLVTQRYYWVFGTKTVHLHCQRVK